MKVGLLGKKIGMTQIFREDGRVVPVTVLEVTPSVITQVKTKEKDGYCALQLGYGEKAKKHRRKSQKVVFDKVGTSYKSVLYEVRFDEAREGIQRGDKIGIDNFEVGDFVDVSGVSIGKGFQGVVKRHHFSGGSSSHGDKTGRRPGSIGQSAYPSRVFKGMKLPGRMGNKEVTVQNLEVVQVDIDNNLLVVGGAVPGAKNSILKVSLSLKRSKDKELKIKEAQKATQPPKAEKKSDQPVAEVKETQAEAVPAGEGTEQQNQESQDKKGE